MSDEKFTKLFKYMREEFVRVNRKLDEEASQKSVNRLTNTIDAFIKRPDEFKSIQDARIINLNSY